jgi:hypothetical protein
MPQANRNAFQCQLATLLSIVPRYRTATDPVCVSWLDTIARCFPCGVAFLWPSQLIFQII